MRMPSCVLHPSHDSVACRFSFMLHCSCHKVSFSHFLSPLLRVSLWFFLCWYSSVCWVPVFVSFLCEAHGYNPDHNLLKHFQKTQHKLNHFMNTCILSLLFPQCWFQAFAKAQTSLKSTLKGTGRKSSQVFRKLWPGMKVVPLCHLWGHYSI